MIKRHIIKFIRKFETIEKLIWEYGFITKFPLRLFVLNFITSILSGKKVGKFKHLHFSSNIVCPERIEIGGHKGIFSSLVLSGGCYIQAGNGVKIGNGTIWAQNVIIISANHNLSNDNKSWDTNREPVIIGENCWIGANAVILPGVTLGDNTIVGAGSIVTKSFHDHGQIIAGNPAKAIKPKQCP